MEHYTRVFSKDDAFPSVDELADLIRDQHPSYKLSIEEGTEEEWETLLLSGNDDAPFLRDCSRRKTNRVSF